MTKPRTIRKFYSIASQEWWEGRYQLLLDGKRAHTPKRKALSVAHEKLADAIVSEFNLQIDVLNPVSMPMTQLAHIALDLVPDNRSALIDEWTAYGETDLLCYRSDNAKLAALEHSAWSPVIAWVEERYGVRFTLSTGIMPVLQPADTVRRLNHALTALDDYRLAACAVLVPSTGSLLLALAMLEGFLDVSATIAAAQLDENFQTGQWGEDNEKETRLAHLRKEIEDAATFLSLIETGS